MHYLAYVVFVEVYKCLARSFLIIFIPQTLEFVSEKRLLKLSCTIYTANATSLNS